MAAYLEAFRTSRQLFPDRRDWAAFLRARLLRKLRWPIPPSLRLRAFRIVGLDGPVLLRPHTADFQVAREIFVRHEYQRLLGTPPDDVRFVLDLGANIGLSARLWLQMFPDAQIVAVEPEAENAGICRENARLGGQAARVTVLEAAAAPSTGLGILETGGAVCSHRLCMGQTLGGSTTQVQTLSIEGILGRVGHDAPIDLLKCDIEGGEQLLFAQCASWIGRVRALLVETHGQYSVEQLAADLARGGSRLRLHAHDQRGPQHALCCFSS